jgi:alginate O-acetyltransferase complex protein AlgI
LVFSSLVFIIYFLPIVLLLYYILPRKFRNLLLFVVSMFFYSWGEPVYILLMVFSTVLDYTTGGLVDRHRDNERFSKGVVAFSVVINLSLLCFFKYSDFIIIGVNGILGTNITPLNIPLPIGISFYTFQTMSYTIDVYRKDALPQKNIISFGAYVVLFPQLIAGPIVRYKDIAEQLDKRLENIDQFADGIKLFIIGLGKKVLLANNIGLLWNQIQSTAINEMSVLTAWIGIIAFAFQIYFDFSGYSDMASGLCKMFGFELVKNFNYPYISKSITEFWRRWHISLSTWFKEYVYIPLGGNRGGKLKGLRNLLIVWFLTGLWHGASWNFVMWGLYFGIIIAIEKMILSNVLEKLHPFLRHVYVIILVLIGFVLFSFENIKTGFQYIKLMLSLGNAALYDSNFIYYLYTNTILLTLCAVGSTPWIKKAVKRIRTVKEKAYYWVVSPLYFVVMFLAIAYIVDASYNPFLYFRF